MKKRAFVIGEGVRCDLERLVNTRLLVQANSGGGKSWAIRRLLEQTHGAVQQLVIDPEGEFSSLRATFDYVLASRQGGDTLADPRSAKLLGERLLELGVSAIVDIYELKPHERVRFVRVFLDSLVEAPKHLWHPALVVLDEAHVYAPEKGDAESADAVKSLATRGRKRGFCLIAATQRLSKLSKDVAAECNNKLIGRSSLDVDMKRAADELGFTTKEQLLSLRDLDAGEFYAFGPALSRTVERVTVGSVQTQHPKAGSHLAAVVPPASETVRAVLAKLADLPAEAEAREKSVADLKHEVADLKRKLTLAEKAQPKAPSPTKAETDRSGKIAELKAELTKHRRALEAAMKILVKVKAVDFQVDTEDERKALEQAVAAAVRQITGPIEKRVTSLASKVEGIRQQAAAAEQAITTLLDEKIDLTVHVEKAEPFTIRPAPARAAVARRPVAPADAEGVSRAEQRVLNSLAWWSAASVTEPTRHQVAFVARYTVNGHFNNLVGGLRTKGLLDYPTSGGVALTDAGAKVADPGDEAPTREALIEKVREVLRSESVRRIFDVVVLAAGVSGSEGCDLTRDELAKRSGYTVNGHFNNMVGSLRSLGVIEYPRQGGVRLAGLFNAL